MLLHHQHTWHHDTLICTTKLQHFKLKTAKWKGRSWCQSQSADNNLLIYCENNVKKWSDMHYLFNQSLSVFCNDFLYLLICTVHSGLLCIITTLQQSWNFTWFITNALIENNIMQQHTNKMHTSKIVFIQEPPTCFSHLRGHLQAGNLKDKN